MTENTINYILHGPEVPADIHTSPSHLVVFLHGLGADGFDLIGLAKQAQEALPNPYCIAPNAPFRCDMSPFGYQWFSLFEQTEEHVTLGIRKAAPYLQETIDFHLQRLKIAPAKLVIIGFSKVSMMALHYGLHQHSPATIVAFSGALLDPPLSVSGHIPNICLIHGTQDDVVPAHSASQASKILNGLGVTHELHLVPALAHSINGYGLSLAEGFIKRHSTEHNSQH